MPSERDTLRTILINHSINPDADDAVDRAIGHPECNFELYSYFANSGQMPYGTMKARTGDPDHWMYYRLAARL
jgi:hypothetical protein